MTGVYGFQQATDFELNGKIESFRNDNGHVHILLVDEEDKEVGNFIGEIKEGICEFQFLDLPKGTYGIRYFHDENDNNEMDRNVMGMPKEGYGFSNDAIGLFGPPGFKDYSFQLEENISVIMHINYL